MKVALAAEMRRLDRIAIEQYAIPGMVLMEHAAICVAEVCKECLQGQEKKKTLLVCGGGNNGGDGFAAARLLQQEEIPVEILFLSEEARLSGDALLNYKIAVKLNIPIYHSLEELPAPMAENALVVDAIFGTGLSRPVGGVPARVMEEINKSGCRVVSVDVPSGVCADDGHILGIGVRADITVTFAAVKRGLLLYPGAEYAGEVRIADISIPKKAVGELGICCEALTGEEARQWLPKRPKRSNKGSFGKLFVAAGCRDMAGACMFAAKAGYLAGAGLVYTYIPNSLVPVMQALLPEAVERGLPEENGVLCRESFFAAEQEWTQASALVVGPGLGKGEGVAAFVKKILEIQSAPLVLDADGLNAVSGEVECLKEYAGTCIVTPHPGEMSRLTKKSVGEILYDPIQTAADFAREYGAITVLKDARTIAAHPDGRIAINCSGNPAMAKGGTGDVLSGIIGGFLAQGMEPYRAAVLGVYVHGLCGDEAKERLGGYSVLAGDVAEALPVVLKRLS